MHTHVEKNRSKINTVHLLIDAKGDNIGEMDHVLTFGSNYANKLIIIVLNLPILYSMVHCKSLCFIIISNSRLNWTMFFEASLKNVGIYCFWVPDIELFGESMTVKSQVPANTLWGIQDQAHSRCPSKPTLQLLCLQIGNQLQLHHQQHSSSWSSFPHHEEW